VAGEPGDFPDSHRHVAEHAEVLMGDSARAAGAGDGHVDRRHPHGDGRGGDGEVDVDDGCGHRVTSQTAAILPSIRVCGSSTPLSAWMSQTPFQVFRTGPAPLRRRAAMAAPGQLTTMS